MLQLISRRLHRYILLPNTARLHVIVSNCLCHFIPLVKLAQREFVLPSCHLGEVNQISFYAG